MSNISGTREASGDVTADLRKPNRDLGVNILSEKTSRQRPAAAGQSIHAACCSRRPEDTAAVNHGGEAVPGHILIPVS